MVRKVLITGENSYIGNKLNSWLESDSKEYTIIKKSVRNNKWREIDFSVFDVIVHVAGIAHQNIKDDQETLYYKVNTELTIEIARKAKAEGVEQFIFISSMSIYGSSSKIGIMEKITRNTIPKPSNYYGDSKLLAEKGILPLQSKDFNIAILRPPMVYGKNSKGNYSVLSKFAKKAPIFPDIDNQRSMIHIDNLTEFIRLIIENKEKGIFFPQNSEYTKTSEMVKTIAEVNGRKIRLTPNFNFIIKLAAKKILLLNKIFGNLIYEKEISQYKINYIVREFKNTIEVTEGEDHA